MQTNVTKEKAREFMQQRQLGHRPLPSMQEIRRALGWDLVDAARTVECDEPVLKHQVFA
jgi:hypothetical protein